MVRILLSFAAALAACTSSPQENAMPNPNPDPATKAQGSNGAGSDGKAAGAANPTGPGAGEQQRAALDPIPEPVPAAENPAAVPWADSPTEAQGRRTLSTAFVRVGSDGHLTVELRNGQVLVLRNVVMNRTNYCGVQALGGRAGKQYCGGYADVAAARPGGAPAPGDPALADPNPLEPPRRPAKQN